MHGLIRIYLGLGLLAKGIAFVVHRDELVQTMVDHDIIWSGAALLRDPDPHLRRTAHGVRVRHPRRRIDSDPDAHRCHFFVSWSGGLWGFAEELRFSALVLFLLLMFVWYGDGPLSLQSRLQSEREEAMVTRVAYGDVMVGSDRPS